MTDLKKHAKVLCRQRRQLSHRPSPDTFWLPKFGSGPRDGGVGEQRTCWSRSAQPAAAERRVPAPTCCRPLPPPTEPLAAPADCQLCSYSASSWTNRMAGTNCWQPCRWARHRVPIPRAGAKRCGPTLLHPSVCCHVCGGGPAGRREEDPGFGGHSPQGLPHHAGQCALQCGLAVRLAVPHSSPAHPAVALAACFLASTCFSLLPALPQQH